MPSYVVATVRRVQNRKVLEAYWAQGGPNLRGHWGNPLGSLYAV
jgi:hypothetical protein